MKRKKYTGWDIFVWVLFVCALIFLAAVCASDVKAGQPRVRVCATCKPQAVVVNKQFAAVPVVNHAASAAYAYTPQVMFDIDPRLKAQAAATYQDRRSPEYEALLAENQAMKAWRAGFEAGVLTLRSGATPVQSPPAVPVQSEELILMDGENQVVDTPPAVPTEPVPGNPVALADTWYPTLKSLCANCHSGPNAKAGFHIDGKVALRNPELAADAWLILKMTYNGHMPLGPDGKPMWVSDEDFGKIVHELLVDPDMEMAIRQQRQ